jgi:hypothetical protein
MIAFQTVMSPLQADLIPKKPTIPRYLWYFHGDIGRMGDLATWVANRVNDRP